MSAESGIATFRGVDGLWEGHRVEEVASPEGFDANPSLVLEFYNQRRRQIVAAEPNEGHLVLARLEEVFDVHIVTQNVDDLHERAGSQHVLHLHGEIRKARSTGNPECVLELEGTELSLGDLGPDGHQLRPHIVWFGERCRRLGKRPKSWTLPTWSWWSGRRCRSTQPRAWWVWHPSGCPSWWWTPIRPSKEGGVWKCCQSGPWKGSRCWRRDGPQRTRRRQAPTFDVSSN